VRGQAVRAEQRAVVKYAVLIYHDETIWENAGPELREHYDDRHALFRKLASELGIEILGTNALQSVATATTLRRNGASVTVTDGPFAETAEQLGGYYLLDAPSLDAVTEALRVLPEPTFEIRPIENFD
jgi:hypothetical protein